MTEPRSNSPETGPTPEPVTDLLQALEDSVNAAKAERQAARATRSWLAVPGPGDYVTLVPADGSGPDFFVKLADYERVADELAALKNSGHYD